jgi:hypothetical protein
MVIAFSLALCGCGYIIGVFDAVGCGQDRLSATAKLLHDGVGNTFVWVRAANRAPITETDTIA